MAETARALATLARNRALMRVAATWLLFVLSEYSVWIAMLVYAYGRGGASTAGVVAVAQLLPGVVAAPVLSTIADRGSPIRVLVGGYAVQTVGMFLTAIVLYSHGSPLLAYAGAVVASTAITATRPAQAAITPALARSADELTALNAVLSWLENFGVMAAGALTGLALSTGRAGLVFALGAAATAAAAAMLATVRVPDQTVEDEQPQPAFAAFVEGFRILGQRRQPRLLVGLITAEYVVIGALDLLFVVLAVSVLHRGSQWAGFLNTAYGVGGVAATAITVALIGRLLSAPLILAAATIGVALAATAFSHSVIATLLLLGAVGVGRAVLDTAAHTLLQRTVSPDVLGRVFGVVEGLTMAGLAAGSLLVPLLGNFGGTDTALIGTALVVPLVLALGGRAITSLDAAARVPVVELSLLRAMPHFRALPAAALEGLAHAVVRETFDDGDLIIRQGEPGDRFYAIAQGKVDIFVDGERVATRERPEGLGEIALLRAVPRSATVVAAGRVVLYGLDGDRFITVVTGHEPTSRRAHAVATARLPDGD
jgi:hypothetical protein